MMRRVLTAGLAVVLVLAVFVWGAVPAQVQAQASGCVAWSWSDDYTMPGPVSGSVSRSAPAVPAGYYVQVQAVTVYFGSLDVPPDSGWWRSVYGGNLIISVLLQSDGTYLSYSGAWAVGAGLSPVTVYWTASGTGRLIAQASGVQCPLPSTATVTATVTQTPTRTLTPTATLVPTLTPTVTPTATLWQGVAVSGSDIVTLFEVGYNGSEQLWGLVAGAGIAGFILFGVVGLFLGGGRTWKR